MQRNDAVDLINIISTLQTSSNIKQQLISLIQPGSIYPQQQSVSQHCFRNTTICAATNNCQIKLNAVQCHLIQSNQFNQINASNNHIISPMPTIHSNTFNCPYSLHSQHKINKNCMPIEQCSSVNKHNLASNELVFFNTMGNDILIQKQIINLNGNFNHRPTNMLQMQSNNTNNQSKPVKIQSISVNTKNEIRIEPIQKRNRKKDSKFQCTECGKKYKHLCNLKSHEKIHTDQALVCQHCNKRFGRKANYNEHVRIHTGETPYQCSYCFRKFKHHHSWKDHVRIHTGECPYKCTVCDKRFKVGHNLTVHLRIHTGEKPYKCNICYKPFRQKSGLNSHIKRIHNRK